MVKRKVWRKLLGFWLEERQYSLRISVIAWMFFIFSETAVLGITGRELEGTVGGNSPGSDLLRRFRPEQSGSDTGHLRESLFQHMKMSQGTCLVVQFRDFPG